MIEDDRVSRAYLFAKAAHAAVGQVRKYTGDPYIVHPVEVMEIVKTVAPNDVELHMACLLHDVLEDTKVSFAVLAETFNLAVASLVEEVTDKSRPEHGNRAERKAIDRAHLATVSARAQTLKLADLIANSRSIVACDPSFAKVYLAEKRELLWVLTKGDPALMLQAQQSLKAGMAHIDNLKG